MKLIRKQIDKNQSGYITFKAENDEDMWHAYNLINVGDEVRSAAVRKIVTETNSATGAKDSHRVRLNLTIEVKKISYSGTEPGSGDADGSAPAAAAGAGAGGASLHLSGTVSVQNEHVKLGAFHTLDLEPEREFTIIKPAEGWDGVALARVTEATDAARDADVGAVLSDEQGRATVCLIGTHTTVIKQRIEVALGKKSRPGQKQDKALDKYLQQVTEAVKRHFNLTQLKMIILASPGESRELIYDALFANAARTGNKALLSARSKFQRLFSPSIHVQSLHQVISSPQVSQQLKETKFAKEIEALNRFDKLLDDKTDQRAWYGEKHVQRAAERAAIGTLLISDSLFRNPNPEKRKEFISLTESVKQYGGQVLVFSSMHTSGIRLNELSGIAAVLTFPLDIEVIEAEEREGEQQDRKPPSGT